MPALQPVALGPLSGTEAACLLLYKSPRKLRFREMGLRGGDSVTYKQVVQALANTDVMRALGTVYVRCRSPFVSFHLAMLACLVCVCACMHVGGVCEYDPRTPMFLFLTHTFALFFFLIMCSLPMPFVDCQTKTNPPMQ